MTTPPVVNAVRKNHQRYHEGNDCFVGVVIMNTLGWTIGGTARLKNLELKIHQTKKFLNNKVWVAS